MLFSGILLVIFLCSFFGTWWLKRYALAKQIMDIPNARSSHATPVPRGGGMAFVVVFLLAIMLVSFSGLINLSLSKVSFIALAAVALLGFCDDKLNLSPKVRCVVQLCAAALVVFTLYPLPDINLQFMAIHSGILLEVLVILFLVWLLNLYNFMDGINGIASIEAISVCSGMAILYWLSGHYTESLIPLLLAAAVFGFLPWNFPKAQIFMGDAGSSFLGLALGILSLQALTLDDQLFWSCLVLLGVFIVDASVTITRRAMRGEKIYLAHCSHAYQNAARKYKSHTSVTFMVLAINLLWLLPISVLISMHYIHGFYALILAYLPLLYTSLKFNAGKG